jgi:hypothetical protein
MDPDARRDLDSLRISTQADLQHMWELLMRPLGWRELSVWLTFLGHDRRPTRLLVEVAESDGLPSPRDVESLYAVLAQVLAQEPDAASVALLITRPGRDGLTADDRALAARLVRGARRAGVPLEPLHVATDVAIWAVAPDDLAA